MIVHRKFRNNSIIFNIDCSFLPWNSDHTFYSLKMKMMEKLIQKDIARAAALRPKNFIVLKSFLNELTPFELQYSDPVYLLSLSDNHLFDRIKYQYMLPKIYKTIGSGAKTIDRNDLNVHFGGKIAIDIKTDNLNDLQIIAADKSIKDFPNHILKMDNKIIDYWLIPVLHFAAQCGSINCFKFLLLNGADPLLTSISYNISRRWDAMAFAASSGNFRLIKILDEWGVRVNELTAEAASQFFHHKILKWLYQTKGLSNNNMNLALIASIKNHNLKCLNICLSANADPNIQNDDI